MAIRTKEELLNQLNTFLGENNSDEALELITDVRDTLGQDNSQEQVTQLQQQLTDLDKIWRQKYRDAFFSGTPEPEEQDDEPPKPRSFDDLFTTKEG